MSNSNGMYNVLNIFKKLEPTQEQQVKAEAQSIYESVEAKGSILEGVKSVEGKLNEKYLGFKKTAAAAKAGGAENPDAVAASIGRKKYGKKAFQKAAASGTKMREEQVDEMFAFDAEPTKDRGPRDTGRGDELARREKTLGKGGLGKGKPFGKEYKEKGKYGNSYNIAGPKGVLPEGEREDNPRIPGTQNTAKSRYNPTNKPAPVKKLDKPTDKFDKIKNEVAPPGKKAEKMVKGMKANFAKDGKLTDKEKSIAYATTWKAHNAGKVEESRKRQIAEGINFAEMMRDTDDSVAEMLGEIQADIDSFKKTGHCSDKLEAFLKIHNHGKRLMGEAVPKGSSFAPQDAMSLNPDFAPEAPKPGLMGRAASAIATGAKAAGRALGGPGDTELLDRLARDAGNPNRYNEDTELNELARLAGLTLEGKKSDKADKDYDGDGEIESSKDEVIGSRRKAAGLDEAKPDFLDMDKDGDKKEPMKKAIDDKKKVDESGISQIGMSAADMESQQGRVNVSTNASSDGNKNVTITADGEAADQLMAMLKMAGMGDSEAHTRLSLAEPEAIEVEMDEAEEQYANAPEECYQGQDVINHQGADMNREKKQFAGMPKAGDNPMATPTLQALESMDPMDDMGRRLMREYQSLKLRK